MGRTGKTIEKRSELVLTSREAFLEQVIPEAVAAVLRGLGGDPEYVIVIGVRRREDAQDGASVLACAERVRPGDATTAEELRPSMLSVVTDYLLDLAEECEPAEED